MDIAKMFNEMVSDYDDLSEFWWAWLYSRLHFTIVREVILRFNPKTVLDIGCGTGFQSILHATAGASVVGVDIAADLIKFAKKKASFFRPEYGMALFPVYFEFVNKYNSLIESLLKNIGINKYTVPEFQQVDVRYLPFPNESFDHVNCCGNILGFLMEDHHCALSEMSRVLRKGGTLFLEVDSRWNIDCLWTFIDVLLKGRLGYVASLSEALRVIFAPPTKYVKTKYPSPPFGEKGKRSIMHIKYFTAKGLKRELSIFNLKVQKCWTIHSVTNIIPSTYLHLNKPSKRLRLLFASLAKIEEKITHCLPGNQLVILAVKK